MLHGWIAPTLLPLLMLISVAAFLPVSEIAQVGRQLADTIASTRRLHVVHARTGGDHRRSADAGARRAAARRWQFEDVRFTYPGRAAPALADVTFAVPAGATVALVGPSGAGKTTVANLLLRFWDPDAGAIRLDGVDLRDLTLDGLRGRIALVAQDTYLFNDTLEANVRLARPEATRGGDRAGVAPRRAGGVRGRAAGGPGDAGRRARRAAVRRPAPAHRHRPRVPEGRADAGAGRGDLASGHDQRAAGADARWTR